MIIDDTLEVMTEVRRFDNREWIWPKNDFFQWRELTEECAYLPNDILKYLDDGGFRVKTVVQAGANCGVFPELYSKSVEEVTTFEPDGLNYRCLLENISSPNINIHNKALGDESREVYFHRPDNINCGRHEVKLSGGLNENLSFVDQVRLDDYKLTPDLIHLDIEESEIRALKGSHETIKSCLPVVVLEHGHGGHYLCEEFGYKKWRKFSNDWMYLHPSKHKDLIENTERSPKIAVLVSGTYHKYLPKNGLLYNLDLFKHAFRNHPVDFYYQTWEHEREYFRECGIHENLGFKINYVEDPMRDGLQYDPYETAIEYFWKDCDKKDPMLYTNRKNMELWKSKHKEGNVGAKFILNQRKFCCHQMLQFDMQVRSIPEINDYDYIVKMRWDLSMSGKFPLDDILRLAEDSVVGINCDFDKRDWTPDRGRRENQSIKDKVFEDFRDQAAHKIRTIESGHYCIVDRDLFDQMTETKYSNRGLTQCPELYNSYYYGWLHDPMIVCKPVDLPEKPIVDMMRDQELCASEYGWCQIMTKRRPHKNVNGLVGLNRWTSMAKETWEKCVLEGIL